MESITTGLSNLAMEDPSAKGQCLDDADDESRATWLQGMFPDIAQDNIWYRLRKCDGNLTRTIDELLNLSFIDDGEVEGMPRIPKGIDGFTQLDDHPRGRKGKGKRRLRTSSAASIDSDVPLSSKNVWAAMADDVDFISSRTNLTAQSVRSIYDAENKSLARTIGSIAFREGARLQSLDTLDAITEVQLAELRNDFPTIKDSQLYGLLVVSGNIISAAHELAAAMMAEPTQASIGRLEIIRRYAPIELDSDADTGASDSPSPWRQVNYSKAKNLAAAKVAAGNTAYMQASSASRRAKSDHLMAAAAGHYSDVARQNVRDARELSAHSADHHVRSQSSPTRLDLHGVSVADAVRITKDQVAFWWHSLGDTKYANGGGGPAREGYHIVTGMGRHSKGGAPRIGPAVSRMLVKEGWKVTVGQGEIFVTGKARRS